MKYGIAIVDQICLLEHLALHMLQALNLVILSNHGLNQILLGLHRYHFGQHYNVNACQNLHCSHENLSLFAQNPIHNHATEDWQYDRCFVLPVLCSLVVAKVLCSPDADTAGLTCGGILGSHRGCMT